MIIAEDSPQRHVEAVMNYYADPGDGSPPVPVTVGRNQVSNERPTVQVKVRVRDITGEEDRYSLDSHGFQLHRHASSHSDPSFEDEGRLRTEYYSECERLYREVTGASRVHIFGHRVRRGPAHWHRLGEGNAASRGPLHRVHVDQSYEGAVREARLHLPHEADELLKRRFQIINIWRPISTVTKDPLAVASAQSVPDDHLVAAEVRAPTNVKETWTVLPPPGPPERTQRLHEWFFKRAQRVDEVMLIKCYDSVDDGRVARRAIHSAFADPATVDLEGCRESVEVRALLFH